MNKRMAKVVCTIGPASFHPTILRDLIRSGMNVARLNFSHGSHDSHRQVINNIRAIAAEEGKYVAILQDLAGPKIRLGILPDEGVTLETGKEIALSSSLTHYAQGILPISYPDLHEDVFPGETILLADGLMELLVKRIEADKVICSVLNGGVILSRKGVNLPGSKLKIRAFSDKDRLDLEMGLAEKVDFVAISFVRTAEDLDEVRALIQASSHKPRLIAKIEKPQAVDNLQAILDSVDAVMVARGDLGVEMPLERVPVIQKEIIKSARSAGKTVITATQMLMSMVASPRPTRSEASDVANAIIDGTDAVMLSDESASGSYPVQSCKMLGRIVAATEPYIRDNYATMHPLAIANRTDISYAVGHAAASLADDIRAAAVIAYTESGFTAYAVSRFRPACPILALTTSEAACRQIALCWGAEAVLTNPLDDTDDMFAVARRVAIEHGIAKGKNIVLTAGAPGSMGSTTLLRVMEI